MGQIIYLKYDSNLEDIASKLQDILGTGYQGAWVRIGNTVNLGVLESIDSKIKVTLSTFKGHGVLDGYQYVLELSIVDAENVNRNRLGEIVETLCVHLPCELGADVGIFKDDNDTSKLLVYYYLMEEDKVETRWVDCY